MLSRISGDRGIIYYEKYNIEVSSEDAIYKDTTNLGDRFKLNNGLLSLENLPLIMPNGIKSGGIIEANSNTDKIDIANANLYIGGTSLSLSGATGISFTRSTNGAYQWILVSAKALAGSAIVEIITGEGSNSDWNTNYGTAMGSIPYCDTNSIILGYLKLSSTVAGTILASEIEQNNSEYAISPSYEIDYLRGFIQLGNTLPLAHTGGLRRKIYCDYNYSILEALGGCKLWNIREEFPDEEHKGYNEIHSQPAISIKRWKGTLKHYRISPELYKLASSNKKLLAKFYYDSNRSADYLLGYILITYLKNEVKYGHIEDEELHFKGYGELLHNDDLTL